MPRRLQIPSREMNTIQLYLIYQYGDVWEEEWRPLQGVMDLPSVTKEVMDQALTGWTKPLVNSLGPPPKGKLLQMPRTARHCQHEKTCPLFDANTCSPLKKKMPWCFEPAGIEPGILAAEVVKLWRSEVYVVVVRET